MTNGMLKLPCIIRLSDVVFLLIILKACIGTTNNNSPSSDVNSSDDIVENNIASVYIHGARMQGAKVDSLVELDDDTITLKSSFYYVLRFKKEVPADFTVFGKRSSIAEIHCTPDIKTLNVIAMDEATLRVICQLDTLIVKANQEGAIWLLGDFKYVMGKIAGQSILFVERETKVHVWNLHIQDSARIAFED